MNEIESGLNIVRSAKNIAIIGLSPNPSKDSNIVGAYLKARGFCIIPIYPKEDFILGARVYRDIKEAFENDKIEVIVVFRKSEFVDNLCDEILFCIENIPNARALKLLWLQLGISNDEAAKKLRAKNISCVQNACVKIELERSLDS